MGVATTWERHEFAGRELLKNFSKKICQIFAGCLVNQVCQHIVSFLTLSPLCPVQPRLPRCLVRPFPRIRICRWRLNLI